MVAMQVLSTTYLVTGFLGVVGTTMLQLIGMFRYLPKMYVLSEYLKAALRLVSPSYCFAQAQLEIILTYTDDGAAAAAAAAVGCCSTAFPACMPYTCVCACNLCYTDDSAAAAAVWCCSTAMSVHMPQTYVYACNLC
jgi:hypothetical protein